MDRAADCSVAGVSGCGTRGQADFEASSAHEEGGTVGVSDGKQEVVTLLLLQA